MVALPLSSKCRPLKQTTWQRNLAAAHRSRFGLVDSDLPNASPSMSESDTSPSAFRFASVCLRDRQPSLRHRHFIRHTRARIMAKVIIFEHANFVGHSQGLAKGRCGHALHSSWKHRSGVRRSATTTSSRSIPSLHSGSYKKDSLKHHCPLFLIAFLIVVKF